MCTADDECPVYRRVSENDETETCVAASVCKMFYSGYAYEATKECSTQQPNPNGNFDPEE